MSLLTSSSSLPHRTAGSDPAGTLSQIIRVLVVGDPHVGKSLLLHRLCHQVFADGGIEEKLARADSSSAVGDATIGFAVSAFSRDTFAVAPSPALPTSGSPTASTYTAEPTASLYARHETGRYSSPTGRDAAPLSSLVSSPSAAPPSPCLQTVELFELGGARNFQPGCLAPVGLLNFDGWCFLYDQDDAETASHLVAWYEQLKVVVEDTAQLAQKDVLLGQGCVPGAGLPSLLLVGTKLTAGPIQTSNGRGEGSSRATDLPDEAYLDTNLVGGAPASGRRTTASSMSSLPSSVKAVVSQLSSWLGCAATLTTRLRPSYILSEARQQNKHSSPWYFPIVETLALVFLTVERVVLFLMATFLFGPNQHVISMRHYSSQQAIRLLRDVPQCYGHIHLDLQSQPALEASLEDLLRFFDSLHARKLRTGHA